MSAATEIKEDVYRLGWRDVTTKMPDGTVRTKRIPLTMNDCLHPEENDVMPASTDHDAIIDYLKGLIRRRLVADVGALVTADCLFRWGHPSLRDHSPDIAVTFDVRDLPNRIFRSFDVKSEGVKPKVVIEVVSLDTRENDVTKKVDHYHQLGIPWYFIVDREDEDGPRSLIGYRYAPSGYVRLKPTDDGWLWVEPLNLWMEATEQGVNCYDGDTRQRLLTEDELDLLAEQEAARANREWDRAEQEKANAEREKARADKETANAAHEKARADAAEARLRELEAKSKEIEAKLATANGD